MSENASTGAETGSEGVTPATTPETPAVESVDQLPDFAKKMISDLRNEAAKHRTSKGEAVEAVKTEVTQGFEAKLAESNAAHEATKGKLAVAETNLLKLKVALDGKFPVDKVLAVADLLKGNSLEELKAHAETLKSLFGSTGEAAVDPTQGQGGAQVPANADEAFSQYMLGFLNK